MTPCAACYTRYSTDRQSPLSTEDQLRKCREFADRKGWQISTQHIYSDEASSGAGVDRPALKRLLQHALSSPPPFQVILLDDTSRLSRSLSDALRIIERLNFAGVRVVAVSQGIDSQDQQAEVLVAVHGLVDSLYIKELAQKTHRGLEGKALRGLSAGGRCYGYSSEQTDDGVAFKVNKSEAAVVRRIFRMSAEGQALKTIAKALNAEGIQSPRPRKGRPAAGWCPTGIREMLYNERYTGRIFWNRSRFVKVPGTNRRVRRPRPPEEWCIVDAEHLRIIPDALWRKVHERLSWLKETYAQGRPSGLLSRSATSRYLFSGFLVCASCGGNLTIVSGSGKRNLPRYGCPRHFNRGTCTNSLTERQDRLESSLLEGLQQAVLQPDVADYVLAQFGRELGRRLQELSMQMDGLRRQKSELETELRHLTAAVAECGHSASLLEAIAERESKLRTITDRLLAGESGSIQSSLDDFGKFVHARLKNVRELLYSDVERARIELSCHVDRIIMRPQEGAGSRHYVATGEWNLIGREFRPSDDEALAPVELVAGAGFEPATFGL